jgi:hypothetical protein
MNRSSATRTAFALATIFLGCSLSKASHAAERPTSEAPASERPASVRCATSNLREAYGPWIDASEGERGALPCDHTPIGPPANPQIGDSWDLYIWRLNGFP